MLRTLPRVVFAGQLAAALVFGGPGLKSDDVIASPLPTPALPLPIAPPRASITDPKFAASPIRELRRAWDDCTWGMVQAMLMNERTKAETVQWVFGGCADEESRLTGALVRKYGFNVGNAAMERAKQELRAQIEKGYQQQEAKRSASGIVASADGWIVKRLPDGKCIVEYPESNAFGRINQLTTLLQAEPNAHLASAAYILILTFISMPQQSKDELPA
jgi:hypothetical protein